VQWIRSAAPYIHALRGKTLVIAFGGEVVADDTFLGIIHDLNLLHSLGVRLVVVHGSRPQIEAILKQQSIPSRYNRGLRVTDEATIGCRMTGRYAHGASHQLRGRPPAAAIPPRRLPPCCGPTRLYPDTGSGRSPPEAGLSGRDCFRQPGSE
jgi:hypothetical protein